MKKTFLIKAVSVILLALILVPVFTSCSSDDEVKPYKWFASEDGAIISNSDRTYYMYELPVGYTLQLSPKYYFQNRVEIDGDEEYVYSYARSGEMITLSSTTTDDVCYVTEKGLKMIEALITGRHEQLYFHRYGCLYKIDEKLLNDLNSVDTGIEINVSELQSLEEYTVRHYDETRTVYRTSGALYEYRGALWYVNFDELSNEYFDSEGNFSYRSGKVTMYELITDRDLYYEIADITENGEEISREYIKERKDIKPVREKMDPDTRARAWFWVAYSIMAFALPAWPFTIGIINSCSKKHGRSKLWRIQSLAALVWVLIGIVILLLLL